MFFTKMGQKFSDIHMCLVQDSNLTEERKEINFQVNQKKISRATM